MSKRTEKALEVLAAGGYFRKALERHWHGGEKFVTRLYTATHAKVPGIGYATHAELWEAGKLTSRPVAKSSTWPSEWVLKVEGGA